MFTKTMSVTILLALLVVVATGPLQAQTKSEIAVARGDLQADRLAIVAANLPLTEDEAEAFWPLYREYRGEVVKIGDQALRLITDYAKAYNADSLTDEQALELTADYIKHQNAAVKLKEKYLSRFGKILPGKTVARFFHVENKLDALVAVTMADQIPLVE